MPLLETDRLKRILNLALPVIAGMVSQNVLNLVDTAMVSCRTVTPRWRRLATAASRYS